MKPQHSDTIAQGREYLREHLEEGTNCPCCEQHVQMYRRKITSAMAYGLILALREHRTNWFHLENFLKSVPGLPSSIRGDMTKLRYWGLMERDNRPRDDDNPRNGFYRLTKQAAYFVYSSVELPKYCYVYMDKPRKWSDEYVKIPDCLGSKFNYDELMKGM